MVATLPPLSGTPSLPSEAHQGDTIEELREMVRDAVRCHFGDGAAGPMPKILSTSFATKLWPFAEKAESLASEAGGGTCP